MGEPRDDRRGAGSVSSQRGARRRVGHQHGMSRIRRQAAASFPLGFGVLFRRSSAGRFLLAQDPPDGRQDVLHWTGRHGGRMLAPHSVAIVSAASISCSAVRSAAR